MRISRTLAGALVFSFAASSTFVACSSKEAPVPTGAVVQNNVDTCGEPWRATGSMTDARFAATATRLANGKVLVAGGNRNDGTDANPAELYDPATGTWSPAGSLNVPRAYHRALRLTDGRVMVIGGFSGGATTDTAEIYNPATGIWSQTASMSTDRFAAQVTLLSDGRVLVSGGGGSAGANGVLDTAEIYDPARNTWSAAGTMSTARYFAAQALLPDGRVLVAGGHNGIDFLASAEIFDPSTRTWSAAASMSTTRYAVGAAVLQDGRVLVAGGSESASAEIFNPASGTWSPTGVMGQASRYNSETLRLPDGRVVVAGGSGSAGTHADAEIFDAATSTWSPIANMSTGRSVALSAVLLDGRILVAGGNGPAEVDVDGDGIPDPFRNTAETYRPCPLPACPASWVATGNMTQTQGRNAATGVLLTDGTVLAAGGAGSNFTPSNSAELYNPTAGTWSATANMSAARFGHRAVGLKDTDGEVRRVLVVGGSTSSGPTNTEEIYSLSTHSWSNTASMSVARVNPQIVVLSDGKVLVSGGYDATFTAQKSAQIFTQSSTNPSTGTWSAASNMSTERHDFSMTTLPDGKVLAAGGTDLNPGAETYDPTANSWTPTTNMARVPRYSFATVPFADGRVLVAGGTDSNGDITNWTELYDPFIHRWLPLTSMSTGRQGALAVQLKGISGGAPGRILVAGGGLGATAINTAEIYSPCPPNLPPVAVCRNVTVPTTATSCSVPTANVDNGSYDPDNGPGALTLSQTPPGPYLGPTPTFPGVTNVTLTANDSILDSAPCSATVTVQDRTPPRITCPVNQTLECINGGADAGTYTGQSAGDNCSLRSFNCPASGRLPLGDNTLTCTATDFSGNTSTCDFHVNVKDTLPPTTSTSKDIVLWPPDSAMHEITLMDCANFTTDVCAGRLNPLKDYGVITSIHSDEVENAPGGSDGNTAPDMQIKKPWLALVRAERDTNLNGRVYTIYYKAKDPSGNESVGTSSCQVFVPKSSGGAAVNDADAGYCLQGDGGTHPGSCP